MMGRGSVRLTVGGVDLGGLFQPRGFYDSVIITSLILLYQRYVCHSRGCRILLLLKCTFLAAGGTLLCSSAGRHVKGWQQFTDNLHVGDSWNSPVKGENKAALKISDPHPVPDWDIMHLFHAPMCL